MSAIKNVAIVGAGGNIGSVITRALVKSGFAVTAISRSASKADLTALPLQAVRRGEYNAQFFRTALADQHALVVTIRDETIEWQKELYEVAVEMGLQKIIPAEFGSDLENPVVIQGVPQFKDKVDIANALKKAVEGQSRTTWTALIGGPIYDWCLERSNAEWFLGFDIKNRKASIYDGGNTKMDGNNLTRIASAVAKILLHPQKYQNEYTYISEYNISQNDMFEALQKATGSTAADWSIEYRSADWLISRGHERIGNKDFAGVVDLIFGALFKEGCGGNFSTTRKLADEELDLDKEDLLLSTKRVVAAVNSQ